MATTSDTIIIKYYNLKIKINKILLNNCGNFKILMLLIFLKI